MKKILISVLLLFVMFGCSSKTPSTSSNLGYESLNNQDHIIKELKLKDLEQKINNKETFYLMIGRPSCGYCAEAIPDYSKIAKENNLTEVYYVSTEAIAQEFEQKNESTGDNKKLQEYLEKTFKFDGATPIFYKVIKGEVKSSTNDIDKEGLQSWTQILEKFFEKTITKK